MGKVIVIQFMTLDGVVEDPDGTKGLAGGGWAFRFGPEAIAGDKFKLGSIFETGVMLIGRSTWEMFSRIWPERTDDFSMAMNRIPKIVVSRDAPVLDAWSNSSPLEGELLEEVKRVATTRDVVVPGSTNIVRQLQAVDAVDEYRLRIFPSVIGTGERLFAAPVDLDQVSAEVIGPTVLLRYERGLAATH